MKQFRSLAFLAATSLCALSSTLYSDTIERGPDNELDIESLRNWVNTKRQVTVKEIGGNLSLSGEVVTKYVTIGETINGVSQRGSGTLFPSNEFDINAKLMLDYRSDQTWSSIKLEFNNDAGVFSGTTNKIKLSRAYFGARVVNGDNYYVDFELGRKKLGTIFDSKVEFDSFFDGVLAKYDQSFEKVGDFYIHLGTFVINEKQTQFGYAGETGLMNIADSGFYTKVSVIDWDTKNFHNALESKRFDFLVSQMIWGYKFYPGKLKKQMTVYLAGLYNFKAQRLALTDNKKAAWGSYIGLTLGELKKQGDWSLDANYQWLAAQCIPSFDVSGVGLGNVGDTGFYTTKANGTGDPTSRETAGGQTNYQGASVTLQYLLTNNINLQQQWLYSQTLDRDIGPYRKFKQYEIDFIYVF